MQDQSKHPMFEAEACFWNFEVLFTLQLLEPGHLEGDYPITTFFKKQDIVKFVCKRTNNIHEFEGCFLRGQISSNGLKVFNGCIVEPEILLVRLQKSLRNFCF